MVRPAAAAALLITGLLPALAIAAQAYDPEVPVPAPTYIPLPASTALPALGEQNWRSANDTVGAFPRGHIDILKWEAANSPAPAADATTDAGGLTPMDAVRQALAGRPELLASTDMNPFERARTDIAMIEFSRDIQRAWIGAVAARQTRGHAQRAFDTAAMAAELAVRMTQVGNWGQDRLLREQLALREAEVELARARQEAATRDEALVRQLGRWGSSTETALPGQLPELPDTPVAADGLEADALRAHPQLKLAAIDAERAQRGLGAQTLEAWNQLTREAIAGIPDSTAGDAHPLARLVTAAPVLDLRRAALGHEAERTARAHSEATRLAVKIRSNVREAYHQYRIAHDLALQARHALQLRVAAQEDMLLRYNGMLKSTWDLLAAARERLAGEASAVAALRDFWLAHANLQAVLAGGDYSGPDAIGTDSKRNSAGGGH